ncbi:MAG: RidA family protein [Acidobacteria bacterium]|nr:RidA family protein [Acidobacteriota bacterium]MBA3887013.1 RidA family protein [Acidobacteriota bacterium]
MRLTLLALLPLSLLQFGCAGQEPAPTEGRAPAATRQIIKPDHFPKDRPYSFGVQAGDFLYLSGQLGRHISTGVQPEGIDAQTRQAMENIGEVLKAGGMDYANLVKCHVYLDTMDDYTGMNQVYGSFFSERVPARTTVEAVALPQGAGVQISCIGFRDLTRISVVRPAEGTLPAPLGPYSAAVWAGDTLFLSGMGGQFPEGRRLPEPLGEQVSQTLVNIKTTLEAAGLGFEDVVASNVYITRPGEAGELAGAYAPAFPSSAPPRGLIVLPRLPGAIKAEITFVATRPEEDRPGPSAADETEGVARSRSARGVLYTRTESAREAGPGFEEQFRAVLGQLESTLRDAGLAPADIVHVHVYMADLADMDSMNRIFRETFPQHAPARTTIQEMPGDGERVKASLVATR